MPVVVDGDVVRARRCTAAPGPALGRSRVTATGAGVVTTGHEPPPRPVVAAAVVDVLVYVVVLNLVVEHLPQVLSESFTLTLLTAVLLKVVLEVVVVAKDRAKRRFRQADGPAGRVVGALLLWLVLVGSKFVVLEAVDLVVGPRVSLGGFFSVTLLVVVLLLARTGVRRLVAARAG
ncbi:hypothetical protein [Cellulomonas phragmiteti]|uniref:hypothetical protein n=1 Tax=Cellulomonas phragmiteti TaxID=478780 RepID=UPI001EF35A30|nr:hypothetical protein [Cellulomonas phragmiteti]